MEELLLKLAHRALNLMSMARVRRVRSIAFADGGSVCLARRNVVVGMHRLHGRPVSNH
jgi:hypothetical protein